MLILKPLSKENQEKEWAFLSQLESENGFDNEAYYHLSYEEYVKNKVDERLDASLGIGLKEGFVPDTYFFLYDDDRIVGIFKLRHYLNDYLRKGPGHIGYCIKKEERNKGYGKKGLMLAIEELKRIPGFKDDEIYFEIHKDNEASRHVILACGGYLHHENEKYSYLRIPLEK